VELQACTNSLEISQRALAHTKSIIKATRLEITSTRNERSARSSLFQQRKAELAATIQAIDEAFEIISQFKNGEAAINNKFVEMGEKLNTMFIQALEHGNTSEFEPLALHLAEIMGNPTVVSKGSLDQLVQLFRNL
jgi:uncharacterized protein (DUF3084 family)